MRTDIILDHYERAKRIIIDTKFTSILKKGQSRDETLKSGYIYQIYAYLRSQEIPGDAKSQTASGILLHPSIGQAVDEAVMIQNHLIRFVTVDLAGPTVEIRNQLIQSIEARKNLLATN